MSRSIVLSSLGALTLLACVASGFGSAAASRSASVTTCANDVRHPIEVRVTALDPVRRGAVVRLRVTTTAGRALDGAEVRLVHAGGAPVAGATRRTLGALAAGASATADFAITVPASGHRFLALFRVEGEGPHGRLARGAAYNLLPDGPAERARAATAGSGETLVEVQAERVTP